jgi:zinc protease
MKTLSRLLLLAACVASSSTWAINRSTPPVPGPIAPFAVPQPATFVLDNGLTVHVFERHRAPLIDAVVVVRGGALADAPGAEGTAAALADMLTEGAGTRDAFAFDDAVQALGARIDATIGWTSTTIAGSSTSATTDAMLGMLADAITAPRLGDADWQRKQTERLGELAVYRDDPRALASVASVRAMFPTGRLSTSMLGTTASVTALTTAQLKQAWQTRYRPDNATIVVVGDITPAAARKSLERAFGAWRAPKNALDRVAIPEAQALATTSVLLVDKPGAAQSVLQVVGNVPSSLLPLDAPSAVVRTVLGGSFTSRLNTNLREVHGYSYGASYALELLPYRRSRVGTSVKSAVTIEAIGEILKELKQIRDPISAPELARARAYDSLGFPAVLDSGASAARAWSAWLDSGATITDVASYMKRVGDVNDSVFLDAAKRLVDPDHVTIVVVGDAKTLAEPLRRFGEVRQVSAAELLP